MLHLNLKKVCLLQIVSSAIMNAPPPSGVISVLHASSNAHCSSDKHTKEKMVRWSSLSNRALYQELGSQRGFLCDAGSSQKSLRSDWNWWDQIAWLPVCVLLPRLRHLHCKCNSPVQVRIFKDDYPKTDKLVARRNWTDIREVPVGGPIPYIKHNPKVNEVALQGGDLLAVLRVEKDHKMLQHSPIQEYPIISPVLDTGRPSISPQGLPSLMLSPHHHPFPSTRHLQNHSVASNMYV